MPPLQVFRNSISCMSNRSTTSASTFAAYETIAPTCQPRPTSRSRAMPLTQGSNMVATSSTDRIWAAPKADSETLAPDVPAGTLSPPVERAAELAPSCTDRRTARSTRNGPGQRTYSVW